MSLSEENRKDVVRHYLEKADLNLREADIAIEAQMWGMAANRLYYALFHAVAAIFVNDQIPVGSHRGIKAKFGELYVLSGKFMYEHAKILAQMETLRDKADYNVMFTVEEKDVLTYVPQVKSFIVSVKKYLDEK